MINGCNIYLLYYSLKAKKDKLTLEQMKKLEDIGIDLNVDKVKENYDKKIHLAQEAIEIGINLSSKNPFYKGINFYNFKNTHMKSFTEEELEIMNKLIPNVSCMKPVKVVDIKNGENYVYPSINDAGRALHNKFDIVKSDKNGIGIIIKRLRGQTKNPVYKGRFRFEYVDN